MKNFNLIISVIILSVITTGCQKSTGLVDQKAAQLILLYTNGKKNCLNVEDAITYPSPWTYESAKTFSIPESKLKQTSTCGLIQTYLNQPWNILGPWCNTCSNYSMNGIQYFNEKINMDLVLKELFSRSNVLEKLMSQYATFIKDLKPLESYPGLLSSFELLLSSDKMRNIMTDSVSSQLLILALYMIEKKNRSSAFNNINYIASSRHILINMLLFKKALPIQNIPLETFVNGYKVCYENDVIEETAKGYVK